MFRFWGSQEQEAQAHPQDGSSHSWYSSSVVSSPTSSHPSTPGSSSSENFNYFAHTNLHGSSPDASDIINSLKNKSVDELRKLLSDKDAYQQFLLSLDQVKIQNHIRNELRKETLQLARTNLEREPQIMELRNQCRIIRTTELAAAQEKLSELERQKEETMRTFSPSSLIQKLNEAMKKTDEESDALQRQLVDREIEYGVFVQNFKKLRATYHRRALICISATPSSASQQRRLLDDSIG